MASGLMGAVADPTFLDGSVKPTLPLAKSTSLLQLTMSPRLEAAARIAKSSADLEFHLLVESGKLGLDPTLRLLDGLLDALETHFEGGAIRLVLDCPAADTKRLVDGLIPVPRLEVRLAAASVPDSYELQAIETDLPVPTLRALGLLRYAASSEQPLILTLRPNTFPIRPFSARSLASACALISWHDCKSPLSVKRRAAPLSGPGLIVRDLAREALRILVRNTECLAKLDVKNRADAIHQIVGSAELGFWAPEIFVSTPPLVRRLTLDGLEGAPLRLPTELKVEPYFLCVEKPSPDLIERTLQFVYSTLHR